MMSLLKLILIRHGETVENKARIVQGHLPGSLSEKGKQQALTIANKLKNEKFDALYSSDLNRAMETSLILLENRQNIPIIPDARLREQNFGIYEGKHINYILRQINRKKTNLGNFNPEKGERINDFRNRVKEFIKEVMVNHSGHTIVLVTHTGVITTILDIFLLSKSVKEKGLNPLINGAITVLNIAASKYSLTEFW